LYALNISMATSTDRLRVLALVRPGSSNHITSRQSWVEAHPGTTTVFHGCSIPC
jgi:hypothetical protein